MSLMKTLAKVAIGVAAAKGISKVVKAGQQSSAQNPGSGSIFGGAHSNTNAASSGPGLDDLLGGLMGGAGGASGGLGGLLDSLGGSAGGGSGGLDSLLGGLSKQLGGAGAAGGLGGLLGGLMGAAQQSGGSFGDMFNQAAQGKTDIQPNDDQEAAAALMLRAMIQAAKSDGEIDAAEQQRILERLQDSNPQEQQFVRDLLGAPVDVDALVRDTPRGMEQHIYVMSVMGIDLDNQREAQYLDALARGLGLGQDTVNGIHTRMGVPTLYA